MLAAAIIVFREIVEAGLIVGIVLAATRGVAGRERFVAGGVIGGMAGAALIATFIASISSALSGMGQEVFNAGILAVAVVMLAWHNIWMARHGRQLAMEMRSAGESVKAGQRTLAALAAVVAVAVLREGGEAVLFLYGNAVTSTDGLWNTAAGAGLGLAAGAAVSATTYFGLISIPQRSLFRVTSILIAFLAAGMAAQCVSFLEKADLVAVLQTPLWDASEVLPIKSWLGRILHTLIGYDDRPSVLAGAVYAGTLAGIFGLMKIFSPRAPVSRSTSASPETAAHTRVAA